MLRVSALEMAHEPASDYDSGDALFALDGDLRIVSWNGPMERLTGVQAERALGRRCWEVLGGVEAGGAFCSPDCRYARRLLEGRSVGSHEGTVRTSRGPLRVVFTTVAIRGDEEPVFLQLMREAPEAPATPEQLARLSPRQLQVLEFLGEGLRARAIAARLGLSETTVRNHIRELLRRLECHSQLEAVAKVRHAGGGPDADPGRA